MLIFRIIEGGSLQKCLAMKEKVLPTCVENSDEI